MSEPTVTTRPCPACGHPNEAPFLFCSECHSPLIKLGRWRITLNLMLAYAVFMGSWTLREFLPPEEGWDWPLFALYNTFFIQIAMWMVSGQRKLTLLVLAWYGSFFLGFIVYFSSKVWVGEGEGLLIELVAQIPEVAKDFPVIFYSCLAALLVLIFVPAYFRWARRYGWVNASLLVLITLILPALIALASLRLIQWVHHAGWFPSVFGPEMTNLLKSKPSYDKALGLFAVSLVRLFIFEVFIIASIRGYAEARRVRFRATSAAGENAFIKTVIALAGHVRRFMLTLEHLIRYMGRTLWLLAIDLGQILWVFMREVFLPAFALFTSGWLFYLLILQTRRYIEVGATSAAALILVGLLGLLACLTLFMGTKGSRCWAPLLRHQGQLVGWLLPNLMLLFFLLSLTLYATGRVMTDTEGAGGLFPRRLGPATLAVGALLVLLVVVIFVRKRSLFQVQSEEEAAASEAEAEQVAARARAALEEELREGKGKASGFIGKLFGSLSTRLPTAEVRSRMLEVKALARKTGRKVGDHLKGKPLLVDRLAETVEQREEKEAKLRSLESVKASVSPETYAQRHAQYRSDLKRARDEFDRLALEIRESFQMQLTRMKRQRDRLTTLQAQCSEIERMAEAGALDEEGERKRAKGLEEEIAVLEPKVAALQRKIDFLREAVGGIDRESESQSE